jgi:double-strand break repair protein MRE11
MRGNRV